MLNLVWLIPLFPALAFALIVLWANRSNRLSVWVAWIGIGLSWVLSWGILFLEVVPDFHHLSEHPYRKVLYSIPTGSAALELGFMVDPLTAAMLFMVPFVCLMIFIYSKGYMGVGLPLAENPQRGVPAESGHVDAMAARFFAFISLFACGMLGMVVADNWLVLFMFWEVMGLCSYLLIGFWFARKYADPDRITPKAAGLKAFLTTRVGDVIMFLGILLIYSQTGTLSFTAVMNHDTLHHLAQTHIWLPIFGSVPVATVAALLLFGGAVGKSALFPLHVWLPDAMEGPTPVSALIHAATMVSAGVYLVARSFPLFAAVEGGVQLTVVAVIGAFTALFAATVAVAQNDIKRVLAFSTISQLAYMIAALGIGAWVAGVFHLLTHAFFKALLFLASGSVIHGVEHGHHHVAHGHHDDEGEFDPNDMRNMGGLLKKMPYTAWTFIIGGLALSGFPILTAGFWSKDEILGHAFESAPVVFWVLAVAAFLTAFYTGRQIFMTFGGQPRTEAAEHGHESPPSMWVPLALLSVFAVFGGFVGVPAEFPVLGSLFGGNQIGSFVEGVMEAAGVHLHHTEFNFGPLVVSIIVALGGLFVGWLVYGWRPMKAGEKDPVERFFTAIRLPWVYKLLENKYYIDEIYQFVILRPVVWLADQCFSFDKSWVVDPIVNAVGRVTAFVSDSWAEFDAVLVDGVVNGVGAVADWGGRFLRPIQTGKLQNYLLVAVVTVLMLLGLFLYW